MPYVWTDADLNVLAYPYSREQFQADHQNVSLPAVPTQDQWAEFNVYSVRLLPQPTYDEKTQNCVIETIPHLADGEWVIGWATSNKTEQELEYELTQWRQSASCSPFQGRIALSNAGLLSQVQTLIDAPETDATVKVAWEYALEWRRLSPMVMALMAALNLSEMQVDELFMSAAQIKA